MMKKLTKKEEEIKIKIIKKQKKFIQEGKILY